MSLCKVYSIHHTIYCIGKDLTCLDIHTNYHDPNKLYNTTELNCTPTRVQLLNCNMCEGER